MPLLILLYRLAADWTLTQYQVQDLSFGSVTRLVLLFSTITPPAGGAGRGRWCGADWSSSYRWVKRHTHTHTADQQVSSSLDSTNV